MDPLLFTGLPASKQHLVRHNIKETDPELIIHAVCDCLKVTRDELVGPCRKRELTEARYIAIGLILTSNAKIKLKEVAQMFNRDHSTIIYARNTYDDLLETGKEFKKKVTLVKQIV